MDYNNLPPPSIVSRASRHSHSKKRQSSRANTESRHGDDRRSDARTAVQDGVSYYIPGSIKYSKSSASRSLSNKAHGSSKSRTPGHTAARDLMYPSGRASTYAPSRAPSQLAPSHVSSHVSRRRPVSSNHGDHWLDNRPELTPNDSLSVIEETTRDRVFEVDSFGGRRGGELVLHQHSDIGMTRAEMRAASYMSARSNASGRQSNRASDFGALTNSMRGLALQPLPAINESARSMQPVVNRTTNVNICVHVHQNNAIPLHYIGNARDLCCHDCGRLRP